MSSSIVVEKGDQTKEDKGEKNTIAIQIENCNY